MSVLPVESDTSRVSALPVVGIEVPAVYFGKVALDSVSLRVGLSCFRLDPEETWPALLDERGMTRDVDLGVTPDSGPVGGASSGTVRAFGSGKVPGRWIYGGGTRSGTVRAFGSGGDPGRWTYAGGRQFWNR